jgi:hypothetical protein
MMRQADGSWPTRGEVCDGIDAPTEWTWIPGLAGREVPANTRRGERRWFVSDVESTSGSQWAGVKVEGMRFVPRPRALSGRLVYVSAGRG